MGDTRPRKLSCKCNTLGLDLIRGELGQVCCINSILYNKIRVERTIIKNGKFYQQSIYYFKCKCYILYDPSKLAFSNINSRDINLVFESLTNLNLNLNFILILTFIWIQGLRACSWIWWFWSWSFLNLKAWIRKLVAL